MTTAGRVVRATTADLTTTAVTEAGTTTDRDGPDWHTPATGRMALAAPARDGYARKIEPTRQGSQAILGARTATLPARQLNDRAIVDAVLAGDRDAFRQLVERESAAMVRACHRILGDLHEAEDAAQEAFVTAYRSLATWRGDGPFGAWLTRIAVRIAIRQAGRRKSVAWLDVDDGNPGERSSEVVSDARRSVDRGRQSNRSLGPHRASRTRIDRSSGGLVATGAVPRGRPAAFLW